MKRKSLLILLLLIIFFNQCIAQNQYTISKINSENGLPQNTIKDLHFDNAGFLWIATENGLLRYDGYVFKTFSSHSVYPINNRIIRLNCNPENQVFAIDVNGTIAEIRNGKISILQKGSFLHPLYPLVSLGTQLPSTLFRKLNPASTLFDKKDTIIENFVPINENEYFVLYNKSIALYKNTVLEHEFPLPTANKHELFTIKNQPFLLDYSIGFYFFDLKKKKWRKVKNETGLNNLKAFDIISENHHQMPFASYKNRLYQLNFIDDKITSTLLIDSLAIHSNVTSVEVDSVTKQYFIGTENEGLFIYRKKLFKTLLSDDEKRAYYGQLVLNDNYILTNKGDIVGQGPKKPQRGPIERFSNYIISDKYNNLYYASGDTVYKYTVQNRKSEMLFVDRKSEMIVLNLYKDTLWIINANGIYYHINGKNFTSITFANNQNNIPYIVERLTVSKLLFGNCMGLFTYQPSARKMDTILFYPQRCVRSIWRYNDKLFIGTYGEGWKIWRRNTIYNMPLDSRGYLLYSHCFIKDEANYLWIPTNHGLFKYFLPDIESYIDGRVPTLFNYYYSQADGLENMEFNGGCFPCYVKLNNGYYSLPNLSGLVWFKPVETDGNNVNTNGIYIDNIEVNNQTINFNPRRLTLPKGTNVLRIGVSSPFFGDQSNYPIEYRTFGVDTIWKLLNRFTSAIRYTTLPAGKYLLQLRKPNGFGKPYLITSFAFRIQAPWYSSPIAIIGWILLSLLLILLIIRLRVAQYKKSKIELQRLVDMKVIEIKEANIKLSENLEVLQKYQQELIKRDLVQSRFIKIISHDIIAPLRFLTMTTTQIEKQKNVIDKQYLLDSLSDIKNTSENLLALTVDILNWINYQKENVHLTYEEFNLFLVIQEKLKMFNGVAKRKGVQLQVNCPDPLYVQSDINILKIILQNLVSNAVKFTSKGSVIISAGKEEDNFFIEVKDTGKGMNKLQIKNLLHADFIQTTADTENRKGYGIGFMIIRELVALSKGIIHVDSELNNGSCIKILWPNKVQVFKEGQYADLKNDNSIELQVE